MRAATTSGYIFVGSAQHRGAQSSPEEKYYIKTIKPDKAAATERQAYRSTLAAKRKFWEEELAWILEEFGPEAIQQL